MVKIAFHTLGCKVNQCETEAMMGQFENAGYEIVDFNESADIYLVNTCTVTNIADKKSRKMLAKAKKNNDKSLVVAVGCYVQAAQEALEQVSNVDLLVGNTDKGRIVEVVESYLNEKLQPNVQDLSSYNIYDETWLSLKQGHTRAHIKIQDGCDQFCSYCIIPYTRGRIRSREAASIMREVEELVQSGYKELVLTGIHLASYGKQFDHYLLIDLLEELEKVEGLERIRIGSLEPTLITPSFVQRLSQLTKICGHFHLSMQSGNDETLRAMNRKYTTEEFYKATSLLKDAFHDCAITTDLIVGFPGETEAQFESTLEFLQKVDFYEVHVFKYSIRDGTKAANMRGQIDGLVKNQRSHKAMAIAEDLKANHRRSVIDTGVDVLLEANETVEGVAYNVGHTKNYMKVYFEANSQKCKEGHRKGRVVQLFKDGVKAI